VSVDRCSICSRPVDTDYDAECYPYAELTGCDNYQCVCTACRERDTSCDTAEVPLLRMTIPQVGPL
jgi:hypothetical protein